MADTIQLVGLTDAPPAGAISAALHAQHGIAGDAVAAVRARAGLVTIELDHAAGRALVTPAPLEVGAAGRGVLRRATDLPTSVAVWSIRVAGLTPTAGALSLALHEAGILGEDVGLVRHHADGVEIELSAWRYREGDLPKTLLGRPTVVEKKNAEDGLSGAFAPRASVALQRLVAAGGVAPERLRQAIRQAVDRARGDAELTDAVARLRLGGFATESAPVPTTDEGLLLLTHAMATRRVRRRVLAAFRTIPFPTQAERAASAVLESLESEADGQLVPTRPLACALAPIAEREGVATRAAGTVIPGARRSGVTASTDVASAIGSADGLLGEWERLAAGVATGGELDVVALDALDTRVRALAADASIDVDAWEALVALIRAEAAGQADPAPVPLEALSPSSPRYVPAILRRIDAAIAAGRWPEAAALATRGIEAQPDSPELSRRHVRLSRSLEGVSADPIALAMAAERLLRDGKREAAISAFEAANPEPGTLAGDHVARRLLELGRPRAASRFISPQTPPAVRAALLAAAERWDEAVDAWAYGQGHHLGIGGGPTWLDAAARGLLSPTHRALAEGDLAQALSGTLAGTLSEPTASRVKVLVDEPLRTRPFPEARTGGDSPLATFFATPDLRAPLLAAARRAADGLSAEDVAVVRRVVKELGQNGWDSDSARSVATVVVATSDQPTFDALDTAMVALWLDSDDESMVAAAEAILSHPAKASQVGARLDHAASRRVQRALEAFAEGKLDEASTIAQSVLRRAPPGESRSQAAAVLALTGALESLVAALAVPRWDVGKARLAFDVLVGLAEVRAEGAPLADELVAALDAMRALPTRLELGRRRLLTA